MFNDLISTGQVNVNALTAYKRHQLIMSSNMPYFCSSKLIVKNLKPDKNIRTTSLSCNT